MDAPKPAKIVSLAQHKMFTQAAADPVYAAQRGITVDLAQQALTAHRASGEPKLPERMKPKAGSK